MKMYETITTENWSHPGGFAKPNPQSRKFGDYAYDQACLFNHLAYKPGVDYIIELNRLMDAILALYPERVTGCLKSPYLVAVFSDHDDTTLEDVLRVCKVADV